MSAGRLVNAESGKEVQIGAIFTHDYDGEIVKYKLMGWRKPHKISSTGRVFVTILEEVDGFERSFFPNVFGLKIVDFDQDL